MVRQEQQEPMVQQEQQELKVLQGRRVPMV